MSDILSAKSAIQQHRFSEAYDHLLNVNLSGTSENILEEYWSMAVLVLQKLDDVDSYWNFYRAVYSFAPVRYRFKILKYIHDTGLFWKNSFFLKQWWDCLLATGNLAEAQKISSLYLEYLLKKKNFHRGLEFIEEMKHYFKLSVLIQVSQIRFLLQQENYPQIDKVLAENSEELHIALFEYFYFSSDDLWKKSQFLFEVVLERVYEYLEKRNFPQIELRGFVNLLYEYLVFFPNESFGVLYLLKYALISKKKSYVYKVKEVVLGQANRSCTHFDYEKDILAIIKALDSMQLIDTEDDTILANEFDFATDLIHGKIIRENLIKKLERDIQFLARANKLEQVEELKARLKMIDKDNTLFFEESDTSSDSNLDSIVDDDTPLPHYDLYPPVDQITLVSLQSSLKRIKQKDLCRSYKDYLTMLFMLEDQTLIKFFIDHLEQRFKNNPDIQTELLYYRVLYFKLIGDYDRVISQSNVVLACKGIDYEMELDCLYQKAEGYFYSAKWEEAKQVYTQVFNVDANYRQVRRKLWMLNEK
jgi:hypothetical protein